MSVVIPAYDEAARLPDTLDHLVAGLGEVVGPRWEVVVSDDGSTDATPTVVAAAARADDRVRLVRSEVNQGKGGALRDGAAAARLGVVAFLDADLPVPLATIGALADRTADAELVLGSRRLRGATFSTPQPPLRSLGGRAFLAGVRALGYRPTTDPQCGVKVFRRLALEPVLDQVTCRGFAFDVELIERARRAGLRVVEEPVEWAHVPGSSVRPVRDALTTWRDLWRLRPTLSPASAVEPASSVG